MKYFLATEMHDNGVKIDLITIAIVNDHGRQLCITSSEFDYEAAYAKPWIAENVLPLLPPRPYWKTREAIKKAILEFIGRDAHPEFWSWFSSHNWVAFCQLFGTTVSLPKPLPMHCLDLRQEHFLAGSPRLPSQMPGVNGALEDAKWISVVYETLMTPKYKF